MGRVWIKFASKEDRVKGIYALAAKTQVDNLLGKFYGLSEEDLHILKKSEVDYAIAFPEEVSEAHREFHRFWSDKNRRKRDKEIKRRLEELESEIKRQKD